MNSSNAIERTSETLTVGHQIGDYVIRDILCRDGIEITYLAKKRDHDQPVVIREFFPFGAVVREPDGSARSTGKNGRMILDKGLASFRDQARALAAIDHMSIERVLDYLGTHNTGYMVSRWEGSERLSTLLARRPTLDEQRILDLLMPLLEGLAMVHSASFVHGDIRPSRILVRPDGTPVLVGFATARWQCVTIPGCPTVLRPSSYAPVEQLSAPRELALRPTIDIYALGATMYQVVTGVVPPDAVARGGVLLGQPDPLQPATKAASGRFSPHLLSAIDRALVLDEEDRPQDLSAWRAMITGETPSSPFPCPHKALFSSDADAPVPGGRRGRKTLYAVLAVFTGAALGIATSHFLPDLMEHWPMAGDTEPQGINHIGGSAYSAGAGSTPLDKANEHAVRGPTAGYDTTDQVSGDVEREASSTEPESPVSAAENLVSLEPGLSDSLVPPLPHTEPPLPRPKAPEAAPSKPPVLQTPSPEPQTLPSPSIERPTPRPSEPTPSLAGGSEASDPGARSTAGSSPSAPIQNPHTDEIAHLLTAAAEDLSAWRLSTPAGNNAFERYLQVLSLDPTNSGAVEGLKDLVSRYEELASSAKRQGRERAALVYIDRALGALESDELRPLLGPTLRTTLQDDIKRLRKARNRLAGHSEDNR